MIHFGDSDGKKFNLQSSIRPPGKSRDGVRGIADISGFGRVVETIDLDGDGELDIVVGAPLHVYINQTDKLRNGLKFSFNNKFVYL